VPVPVLALLAVPLGPWWAAEVLFVGLLGVPALRVLADILVVRQAPPERRGRVVAAFMTLIALGMPAGVGLAPALAGHPDGALGRGMLSPGRGAISLPSPITGARASARIRAGR
jgi:hypothetical protein